MNGFTFVALIALAIGVVVAWRAGVAHGRRGAPAAAPERLDDSGLRTTQHETASQPAAPLPLPPRHPDPMPRADAAERSQLLAMAEERRHLFGVLADARAETARYRQIVVDIEHNAPPPLLDAPGAPDDLKLIVGVGPVIERMLYQMGIATFRQIARWSERDIDEVDAKLPEFPGRIRRDAWVTQARELHLSKYGHTP
jgi:predicted flap endonuclease-1-like 5' DNA nuclease